MFRFDNTHIFTGYLKQLLASYNLPVCHIYTKEFEEYYKKHGKEDPRVIESFDSIRYSYAADSSKHIKTRLATRVNYLKGNELCNYFWGYNQNQSDLGGSNRSWVTTSTTFYNNEYKVNGLTKTLKSPGGIYDAVTHEYLGDYLRFIRDYYNINLMSLYNCFNNALCNNIYYKNNTGSVVFDARDTRYHIYAIPVKLFKDYTIAIDCVKGIELFCGFYKTGLDKSDKSLDLINKTYLKVNRTFFRQPILYDKLNVKNWDFDKDTELVDMPDIEGVKCPAVVLSNIVTRWDIDNREQDLRLFIKIPASCKSSIVILEGDFRRFNDYKYEPPGKYNSYGKLFDEEEDDPNNAISKSFWEYKQNHVVVNFGDRLDLNQGNFTPIGKLQLLAINTGESYPFADRLVEYLSGSAITPMDPIADNIKRAQAVMVQNKNYFKIAGNWEDKMQKIIYDYIVNSGPVIPHKYRDKEEYKYKLVDRHSGHNPKNHGYHQKIGHTSKSTLYDVLGYVDKDADKWYASWVLENGVAKVRDTIQNVDIYNGLYDI